VRKEFVDLEGPLHTLDNILGKPRSATQGNRPKYRDDKCTIDFIGLGDDLGGKQGNPHDLICVGKETPVLMADGSFKEAQQVAVGDLVATLEGARKVLNAFATPPKESVRVEINGFSQIQSATHKLLTTSGWLAGDAVSHLCETSEPKVYRTVYRFFEQFYQTRQLLWRLLARRIGHSLPLTEACQAAQQKGGGESWACAEHKASPNRESEPATSGDTHLPRLLRLLSSWYLQARQTLRCVKEDAAQSILCFFSLCGVNGVQRTTSPEGCQDYCSAGSHPCGERTHGYVGHCAEPRDDQQGLLLLADAGQQSPIYSRVGGGVKAPRCSPHKWWYDHPYMKDKRQSNLLMKAEACKISPVGRVELFDLEVEEVNHFITMGGFVNKNCIDEAAQVPEVQVRMLLGWLRTDIPGQRCRMVLGSNPPLNPVGDWLITYFAPWLDPKHHMPAQEGELRYFLPNEDGMGDRECGPDDFIMMHDVIVKPQSRTFISSKFTDNPYYDKEAYAKSLAGLPDSARNILISGNFMLERSDDAYQAIPTDWVRQAQARWTSVPPVGVPMCAIGVDVAQGGVDRTVLARRHDGWYAPLLTFPGKDTPDGKTVAGLVITHRRNEAKPIVDIGGGWGGDAYAALRENGIDACSYMGVKSSLQRTKDQTLKFFNVRSEAYWRFREALDPSQEQGSTIMLPNDAELVADLCAPSYEVGSGGIKIEAKDKVCDRLGRSTDKGDAVVMAWWDGLKGVNIKDGWDGARRAKVPQVVMRRK
jgi:hypothetical protein